MPTKRCRKSVEPPSGAEPCRGPAWPKRARSEAIEKSHAMPISWPPAIRRPFTRLMTGLSHVRMPRDHVVEEPHVLLVFLRTARVVLGVLLRVAARAERAIADARQHDAHHRPVARRLAEREDELGQRLGRVAVQLRRVVQPDPGVVQIATPARRRDRARAGARTGCGDRSGPRRGDDRRAASATSVTQGIRIGRLGTPPWWPSAACAKSAGASESGCGSMSPRSVMRPEQTRSTTAG